MFFEDSESGQRLPSNNRLERCLLAGIIRIIGGPLALGRRTVPEDGAENIILSRCWAGVAGRILYLQKIYVFVYYLQL